MKKRVYNNVTEALLLEGRSFKNSGVEFWNVKGMDATVVSEND
jgi:hypothetical protein